MMTPGYKVKAPAHWRVLNAWRAKRADGVCVTAVNPGRFTVLRPRGRTRNLEPIGPASPSMAEAIRVADVVLPPPDATLELAGGAP